MLQIQYIKYDLNNFMKTGIKIVFCLTFILIGYSAFSQEHKIMESKDGKKDAMISIYPTVMNILYAGVRNPLTITSPFIPLEELEVSITDGKVTGKNGRYMVTVNTLGEKTLTVSQKKENGEAIVLSKAYFRSKKLPQVHAKFMGSGGGYIKLDSNNIGDKLVVELDDFEFDTKYKITEFSFRFERPRGGDPLIYSSKDENITTDMQYWLKKETRSAVFFFFNIKALDPLGNIQNIDPIFFFVE